MATRPDKMVARRISKQVADMVLRQNLFTSKVRPVGNGVPARAVFCFINGGAPPQSCKDATRVERPNVMIRVRGNAGKDDDAQCLALAVRHAVHEFIDDEYTDVLVVEALPSNLGDDDNGNPEFSMNVEAIIRTAEAFT